MTDKIPGRELDAEVAKAIGHNPFALSTAMNPDGSFGYIPGFSTTWEGMQLVVEDMERRGYDFVLSRLELHEGWIWEAKFGIHTRTSKESAPHAVCRSALAALSAIKQEGE